MKWWEKVKKGQVNTPPPPESEIFKSATYSNFIYLFFKIATEVNVFSHLGAALFSHMKEVIFSDRPESICEDEAVDDYESDEGVSSSRSTSEINQLEDENDNEEAENEMEEIVDCILDSVSTVIESKAPKTVTSMFGKVYVLKT